MKIRVDNEHYTELKEAIEKAEGKSVARLLWVESLFEAVNDAEKKLEGLNIPKKYWKGCSIYFQPAKMPMSYFGQPFGTFATVTRGTRHWFLTGVGRSSSGKTAFGGPGKDTLMLTPTAHQAIPWEYALEKEHTRSFAIEKQTIENMSKEEKTEKNELVRKVHEKMIEVENIISSADINMWEKQWMVNFAKFLLNTANLKEEM